VHTAQAAREQRPPSSHTTTKRAAAVAVDITAAAAAAAAELVTGIMAWHKMEGQKFNKTAVQTIFNAFMAKIAS
jgi:hypothetical protein